MSSASNTKAVPLKRSNVYFRIRPQALEGGHAQTGENAIQSSKSLHGWDEKSVTVGWSCSGNDDMGKALASGSGERHDYCKGVLAPECTQQDVFDQCAPQIVDQLTSLDAPTDALVFAYGQTGCGKSYTMLGPDASLKNEALPQDGTVHDRWGLFPRMAYSIFEKLQSQGTPFQVSFGSVEFYLGVATDLLAGNAPISLSAESEPLGLNQIVIRDPSEVLGALNRARANRHNRTTKMNTGITTSNTDSGEPEEHSGSSRGHAMFILTITRTRAAGDCSKIVTTTLNLVDLAGAERPDKTGAGRKSGTEAYEQIFGYFSALEKGLPPPKLDLGTQCYVINWELYALMDNVCLATDYNNTKKGVGPPYKPNTLCASPAVRAMSRAFSGNASMTIMVTLSQAPQCGWETWFSCQYASKLARLRAPLRPRAWTSVKKYAEKQRNDIKENFSALRNPVKNKRIGFLRSSAIMTAKYNLALLRELIQTAPGGGDSSGLDVNNCDTWCLPDAPTTGFTWPPSAALQDSLPPLEGKWIHQDAVVDYVTQSGLDIMWILEEWIKMPMTAQRAAVDKQFLTMSLNPKNDFYLRQCPQQTGKINIDTTRYAPCDNPSVTVLVHRPSASAETFSSSAPTAGGGGGKKKLPPALVYAHGGGGIWGKAKYCNTLCARYAVETGCVVFNLEYRLAPENPAPAGHMDAVGVVLYLREFGATDPDLQIDPTRIGLLGESGGGWITAGASFELARRGMSDALKLAIPIDPMVSDIIFKKAHQVEGGQELVDVGWRHQETLMATGGKKGVSWPSESAYVWPSRASKEILNQFPATAIFTGEFDLCRRQGEDLAQKISAAGGPLVEFIVFPGGTHGYSCMFSNQGCDLWWKTFAAVVEKHLVNYS